MKFKIYFGVPIEHSEELVQLAFDYPDGISDDLIPPHLMQYRVEDDTGPRCPLARR
jgi:hypothetical protein